MSFKQNELDSIMLEFQQLFERAGFDEVSLTRKELPEPILKWAGDELRKNKNLQEEILYCEVVTKQGSFGVLFGAYPMVVLEDCGISIRDLDPEFALQTPKHFPEMVGLTGSDEQLLKLRQLLVKKNRQNVF